MAAYPTIARGDFYGGDEGKSSEVQEASGPEVGGAAPALFWIAALGVLVLIRIIWEAAE